MLYILKMEIVRNNRTDDIIKMNINNDIAPKM